MVGIIGSCLESSASSGASSRVVPSMTDLGRPLTRKVDFAPERLLSYLAEDFTILNPEASDASLYEIKFDEQSGIWTKKRKGSPIVFCEGTGKAPLEYFTYVHDNAVPVTTVGALEAFDGEVILYQVNVNGAELCFFNELQTKTATSTKPISSDCNLTAFATCLNSIAESSTTTANLVNGFSRIESDHNGNRANPNEFAIEARIVERQETDSYIEHVFHPYLVEVNCKGQRLQIPLVIPHNVSSKEQKINLAKLNTGDIVNCNILLQGQYIR